MDAKSSNPNVVVVLTTQWRGQATGYAGDGNALTPNLDELAEASIDCFQAVTPHPFGVFARAAFLTGIACPHNGIADYYDALPCDAETWAHRFGEAGYDTAFFGKWQLYHRDPNMPVVGESHAKIEVPEDRRGGFGFWEGFESGFLLNDGFYHGSSLGSPRKIKGYQSDIVIDRSIEYLDTRSSENPVFAVISLDAPHPPYSSAAPGSTHRSPDSILLDESVPQNTDVRETVRRELAGYYSHIEATDRAIGRLIRRLKDRGEWESSIFAFSSVHGDMHGAHGQFRKGWPHEESVRVPLLISWPSGFAKARRDPALISLIDLGPTLAGLAFNGAWDSAGEGVRGRDLSGVLRLNATGPDRQFISMPSVPPFAKQCPYAWSAERAVERTIGQREDGTAFALDH